MSFCDLIENYPRMPLVNIIEVNVTSTKEGRLGMTNAVSPFDELLLWVAWVVWDEDKVEKDAVGENVEEIGDIPGCSEYDKHVTFALFDIVRSRIW